MPMLNRIGCYHDKGLVPDVCRPCSVSREISDAIDLRSMTCAQEDRFDRRILYGWVYEPEGRRALVRLLAIAHEHPDPNTMEGWDE